MVIPKENQHYIDRRQHRDLRMTTTGSSTIDSKQQGRRSIELDERYTINFIDCFDYLAEFRDCRHLHFWHGRH